MAPPRLPNEIFLSIISSIPSSDHATLRACQLTSRAFREYSTPVLYGHLDISWTANKGLALLYSLFDHPSLVNLSTSVKVVIPHVEDLVSRHGADLISKIRPQEGTLRDAGEMQARFGLSAARSRTVDEIST
ncbi:hypothetical protein RQP46_007515 [Phenoliferia psychrophenolica]